MKLSKKITYSFIIAIILSIFIVSIISNIMINYRFDNYLVEEQDNRLTQISDEINKLYSQNGYIIYQREINQLASLENITIKIKDINDDVLYSSTNGNAMGKMRMKGMGKGMRHNIPKGNYVEKSFPLKEDNEIAGTLIIGYIDNSYLTDSALIFKDTLTKSLLISSFFTLIIGIVTSVYLSKSLTKPLIAIRNTALNIQRGFLTSKSNVKTDTIEIKELSDSINYLGETLSKQEEIRKKYASDISHELRTPIATLKGHLEAIIDNIWESSDEHLQILLDEIDRLTNLIDDLKLSYNAGENEFILNKTKFNISNEINNIVTSFIPLFTKKGYTIDLDLEENIFVNMDKNKLKQVISNLLSNSIKYLKENGNVLVSLKSSNNICIIEIIDNGIGIKKEELPFVFDRFYRSNSLTNVKNNGTGLGLPIVKSIVEAHNGTININSNYGESTNVIIELPLIN